MKTKLEKTNLQNIRKNIDSIDAEIISKLAERWALSMSAVTFKIDEENFKDCKRRKELVKKCTELGEKKGIPAEVVTQLYHKLIDLVEDEQKKILKSHHM